MKKKISLIFILFIIFVGVFFNISNAANSTKAVIKMEYVYNEKTNTVTAKAVSNKKLKKTKVNWILSADGLIYSYEFNNNTKYNTTFEDIDGNKITVGIDVNKIIKRNLELRATYGIYNPKTNSVLVSITANNQFVATKKNWKLSSDKLVYSFEFTSNSNYQTSFQDVQGNTAKIAINVQDIDDKGPVLEVKYEHTEGINNVKVIVKSNEKMKATKKNWILSTDELTYTYDFKDNTNYVTKFQDIWGNESSVTINVTQIDKVAPKITAKYTHKDDNTVKVELVSNEKLKETKKNWILSEDKKTYTYIFKDDTDYTTSFQDLCGNTINVKIKAKKKIYNYPGTPNLKVKYLYTSYEVVHAEIISDVKFQDTKPTWKLSTDEYRYTKDFKENMVYKTSIKDVNGNERTIDIIIDFIKKVIKCEEGTYGVSGLKNKGDSRGTNLKYYKIGDGPNVFFATFSIHGFEDLYNNDGKALTTIAENFKNKLIELQDLSLDSKWTIYIFPCLNPDGQNYGWTKNGPRKNYFGK